MKIALLFAAWMLPCPLPRRRQRLLDLNRLA
jgi:hypothetical protein